MTKDYDKFLTASASTLKFEGGFVNHPSDRGGPTKFGITQRTLSAYRGRAATVTDVQNLTLDEAKAIYYTNYWVKPGISLILDEKLQALVFDFGVHAGPAQAIGLLQKLVNVASDGKLGPVTAAKVNSIAMNPRRFNNLYVILCGDHLMDIVERNPSQSKFVQGWYRRQIDKLDFAYDATA